MSHRKIENWRAAMRRSRGVARAVVAVLLAAIVSVNALAVVALDPARARGLLAGAFGRAPRRRASPYDPPLPALAADEARLARIRAAFKFAWDSYKRAAWGSDFLNPLSGRGHDVFSGGLTIADSLDTLLLMGFDDEFALGSAWLRENFTLRGHYSVFEIVIRIVGGMLATYSLRKDDFFLRKASEVASHLLPLFKSRTGFFRTYVVFETDGDGKLSVRPDGHPEVLLSDLGSIQLEFYTLSKLTGDMRFAEAGAKIHRTIFARFPTDGLYPERLDSDHGGTHKDVRSLDSMSDSFYEYLIKIWLLSGGTLEPMLTRYLKLTDAAEHTLTRRIESRGWTWLARIGWGAEVDQMSHLATFSAGMFALGAVARNPLALENLRLADELATSFVQMYADHKTGLMPECTAFHGDWYTLCDGRYQLRPETVESLFVLYRITGLQKYRDYAWTIFEKIEEHCKVKGGYATVVNVDEVPANHEDVMDSYFLAETMKYLYLTFTSSDVISLEEWVFNTEGHPLPVWTGEEAELMKKHIILE
jgi:mannosyl-oligosaccharide alpha-1,2-mannosidase